MNIIQLFEDFNIPYETEGKHTVAGWVNIHCPFCDDTSSHLGFNLSGNYFNCWRCGWHSLTSTTMKLTGLDVTATEALIKQYGLTVIRTVKEPIVKIRAKAHRLPSGTVPMTERHRTYLERRGYDPYLLERTWRLLGTGPVSLLDGLDYKHRIIIPVVWDLGTVSFTSRDITGKSPQRYKVCPKDRELTHHKHILYGRQDRWKLTGICVEGPADVWRLGTSSFATFGIEYTLYQVRQIARHFHKVWVIFDPEPQAQAQADKLVAELRFRNVEADTVLLGQHDDPGSMKQEDADYLVKQLIK